MPREYRRVQEYEKEILELVEQGFTKREIGAKFGLSKEEIKEFMKRYRRKQEKLEAGIMLKPKGRPRKDSIVTEENKSAELSYQLARKEARVSIHFKPVF